MCERRSVGICCHDPPHDEAPCPHLRPFHTVSLGTSVNRPLEPVCLRACADRSWPTRRSAFPTVAAPGFPDQSTHYDHHVGEGNPDVDHPLHPRRTPHQLLVGVVPRTRTLHHPPIRGPMRRRLAFLGDLPR